MIKAGKGSLDVTAMRRELAVHHVVVACTRPGWKAHRESDGFTVTGRKMRHVIMEAHNKITKGS